MALYKYTDGSAVRESWFKTAMAPAFSRIVPLVPLVTHRTKATRRTLIIPYVPIAAPPAVELKSDIVSERTKKLTPSFTAKSRV